MRPYRSYRSPGKTQIASPFRISESPKSSINENGTVNASFVI
jgi:hypothetical protein